MSVTIDLSSVVAPVPTVCTQLRVTFPGGATVQGVAPYLGASPMDASRATIGALSAALAPLAPIFAILDAVLSIVKFAQTVPGVVMRPDKVVKALIDVVKKSGALAKLVPQLSFPLMVLGVIDVVLAFLNGVRGEIALLAAMEERLAGVLAQAQTVPALLPIAQSVQVQVTAQRARLQCAISDVDPVLGTLSKLAELIGLPPIAISGDAMAGTLDDALAQIDAVIHVLTAIRSSIPV